MAKFGFSTDKEYDILFIYDKTRRPEFGMEFGDRIHLDLDKENNVVGIEFYLGASKIIDRITGKKMRKQDLEKINKAWLKSSKLDGLTIIEFGFSTREGKTIEGQLTAALPVKALAKASA